MGVTVLVTGVGGVIGQGIIKSLRLSGKDCLIVAADANPMSAGLYMGDAGIVLPYASDEKAFVDAITRECVSRKIDIVLPGIYQDVAVLSRHSSAVEKDTGAKVVVNESRVLDICEDKWRTYEFLRDNGLSFPATARGEDHDAVNALIKETGFPVILKRRKSHASKGLVTIKDRDELGFYLARTQESVVQEYLEPDCEEYTCGAFAGEDGQVWDVMALKRELACGLTYKAVVSFNEEIRREAKKAIEILRPKGPCNVQLRLTSRGPVIFEMNARFSSSTSIRARFGFNEARMAVESFLLGANPAVQTLRGGAALRYWEDLILDEAQCSTSFLTSTANGPGEGG